MLRFRVALALSVLSGCSLLTDLSGLSVGSEMPPPSPSVVVLPDASDDGAPPDQTVDSPSPPLDVTEPPPPPGCDGVNFQTNPEHCGRCGHDCFGGACKEGICQPRVILEGLAGALGVTVTNHRLYVSVSGKLLRANLDGTNLDEALVGISPAYITSTATHIYWADQGGMIMRWAVAGTSAPEVLVRDVPLALGIAVSASHLFFTRYSSAGTVERAALDGGQREALLSPYNLPEDIEIAGDELLVGGDGANELAAYAQLGTGNRRLLHAGDAPVAMAVTADKQVYFVQQGDNTIQRMNLAGGQRMLVAPAGGRPCGIAVTTDSIYWATCVGDTVTRLALP